MSQLKVLTNWLMKSNMYMFMRKFKIMDLNPAIFWNARKHGQAVNYTVIVTIYKM